MQAREFEKPFIISFIMLRFIQPKINELIMYTHTVYLFHLCQESQLLFWFFGFCFQQFYTDQAHGLSGDGARPHLYSLLEEFMVEQMGLKS